MTERLKVVAAMSGGVDSAVAAARAVDAGHDVVGVHLALSKNPETGRDSGRGCCTLSDARDARRSADILGIPFYVWDMAEEFSDGVLDDFVAEYLAGRTPNPCMRCNEKIKFAAVLDRAMDLGFDAVCTGHYARITQSPSGERELHRSADPDKDQSYVLGVLTAEQLAHSMFPLGDSLKSHVRSEASERGLLVANKPDSYDICFIPDGDTAGWLRNRIGAEPGAIVDAVTGDRLGDHEGAYAYTIGQRKGLGIKVAPHDGQPRYVVGVDPKSRVVSVGPPTLLDINTIRAANVRWTQGVPRVGERCLAQVRAHGDQLPAIIQEVSGTGPLVVSLDGTFRGVAPGQSLVLYDDTRVIGSGTITATSRVAANPSR
ncbi:MAG TPA: tRNA 2-thiouridine(34) synthase MnmA [Actinobacteria bacterium]|nr:tRNA 2-thiouridine(34) synthase MnmA [Actinomycetota bacterium]